MSHFRISRIAFGLVSENVYIGCLDTYAFTNRDVFLTKKALVV